MPEPTPTPLPDQAQLNLLDALDQIDPRYGRAARAIVVFRRLVNDHPMLVEIFAARVIDTALAEIA